MAANRVAVGRDAIGSLVAAWRSLKQGDASPFFALHRENPSLGLSRAVDDTGNTALHWLSSLGDVESARRCIELGLDIDVRSSPLRQTPLMWAVMAGKEAMIDLLLSAGADINAVDSLGATVLILAIQSARPIIFLRLFECGADPRITDIRGCTAAHWAAYKRQAGILRVLRAQLGLEAMIARDDEGYAPLHRASRGGCIESCAFLIDECGVDPRTRVAATGAAAAAAAAPWRYAGNTVGVGIGWCHSTAALPDRHAKKDEEGGGDGDDDAPAGVEDGGSSAGAGGALKLLPSRRSRAAAASASVAGGVAAVATGGASAPLLPPSASNPAETPLDMATDALSLLIRAAESGGEAGESKRSFIATQRVLVARLRTASELRAGRDASCAGKLCFLFRIAACLPRVAARIVVPGLFLTALGTLVTAWAAVMRPASGDGLELSILSLLGVVALLALRLHCGGAGALDPYGALGPDTWPTTPPWRILRHPYADPARYRCRLELGAAVPVPARPSPAEGSALVAAAAAAAPPATPAAPVYSIENPPRTASGEIDYEALVELEVGSAPEALPPLPASPAPWMPSPRLAEAPAPPPLPASSAPAPAPLRSPLSRLFAELRAEEAGVRRAWGDLAERFPAHDLAAAAAEARVCTVCAIVRPLRAEHDPLSDRCYERYDHFSQWLGVPIAGGNFRAYAALLLALTALSAALFVAGLRYAATIAAGADAAAIASGLAPDASAVSLLRSLQYLALFSTPLALYGGLAFLALLHHGLLLSRTIGLSLGNLTLFEAVNQAALPHFQVLALGASGDVKPALRNPFSHPSTAANLADALLGCAPPASGRVNSATLALRDAAATRSIAAQLHATMNRDASGARAALLGELERQRALVAAGGSLAPALPPPLAPGEPRAAAAPDEEPRTPTQRFFVEVMRRYSPFVSLVLSGAIDLDTSSLEDVLALLPAGLDLADVETRVMTLRARLKESGAWAALGLRAAGHGHSHSGGGGGGSGGGGSGGGGGAVAHGHSHGARGECKHAH